MKYDPDKHHRRSIRLKDYDYSQPGAYFVTICTHQKEFLFGNIFDGQMRLSAVGALVLNVWEGLQQRFPTIELDAFAVMPNHVHCIIVIASVEAGLALPDNSHPVGAGLALPRAQQAAPLQIVQGAASSAPTLGDIIRAFKSISAIQGNRLLLRTGVPLWQRNYYEHIIRDDNSLNRIREYIITNPMRWELDRENPTRTGEDEFDRWLDSFEDRPLGYNS